MPERPPPKMGPGRRAVFRPDHKSFGEFILSEQVRDVTADVAHDIAAEAGRLAPRRKSGEPKEGTEMADRFHVNREAGTIKVERNVRVKVEVYNEARSAAPNEFGNKDKTGRQHTPRTRMLGRAGAMFGDFKHGKVGPARSDGTF